MSAGEWGCQSEVLPIRRLLLRHPREAWRDRARIDGQWQAMNYPRPPDLEAGIAEYEAFAALFRDDGIDIHWLEGPGDGDPETTGNGLDGLYVHDPLLVSRRGAILCSMGKPAREGEPAAFRPLLDALGVPLAGVIEPPGLVEGGDVLWLDERTVAVGEGYRTNAGGIRQLTEILGDDVDEVLTVPLPHGDGPAHCLHLMSFISPVDHDLAVVRSPLMPVFFREWLLARGMRFVEVPAEEWQSLGCNVLAVAPGRCIMLDGNPRTRAALEAAGAGVRVFAGKEISVNGAGGATCLTRPLLRA